MKITLNRMNWNLLACGMGLASLSLLPACNNKTNTPAATTAPATQGGAATGKIAYVNLDSLEANYTFFRQKKADFDKRQADIEAELSRLGQQFQNEYMAFQKKVQAGTMSQTEGEATQKRLAQLQQNVESRRQNLGNQLMEEQQKFNDELQKRLDIFLEKYNKDKQYDYILSYVKGGSILLANPALDITRDIIKGMNEQDKETPEKKDPQIGAKK